MMNKTYRSKKWSAFSLTLWLLGSGGLLCAQTRTVSSSEIGNIQTNPNGYTWAQLGAYDGTVTTGNYSLESVDALKIKHSRLLHYMPADETGYSYFPYSELKEYEAEQVAAGNEPIFITATYEGKHRPVYFIESLLLDSSKTPTAPSNMWMQAVNVGDSRFVDFFVNKYVYGILWPKKTAEDWVALDNFTVEYEAFGVLDDNNHFVGGVPWDSLFPQNSTEQLNMVASFFSQLKESYPDVASSLIPNVGSLDNWSNFPTLYANIANIETESLTLGTYDAFSRNKMLNEFTWYSWFTSKNRPGLFRSEFIEEGSSSSLQTAVVSYMLVRGVNTFFAPRYNSSSDLAVPPADYQSMIAALGPGAGSLKVQSFSTLDPGYALYSRTCENGIVYLNWSGASRIISLPSGHTYRDPNGNTVTQITVPDITGTYVTYK